MARLKLSFALMIVLCLPSTVLAQPCDKTARTRAEITAYDSVPVFYTGSGWRYGREEFTVPADSVVKICDTVSIGFFLNKKRWHRILFQGQYGWVFSGNLSLTSADMPASGHAAELLIRAAAAQPADHSPVPGNEVPAARYLVYVLAFVAIVLGILGKVVFDALGQPERMSLRVHARKCLRGLIIAPMVFLAFLTAGDFPLQTELNLIVGMCMAFQNGFFFQTVISPQRAPAPEGT